MKKPDGVELQPLTDQALDHFDEDGIEPAMAIILPHDFDRPNLLIYQYSLHQSKHNWNLQFRSNEVMPNQEEASYYILIDMFNDEDDKRRTRKNSPLNGLPK